MWTVSVKAPQSELNESDGRPPRTKELRTAATIEGNQVFICSYTSGTCNFFQVAGQIATLKWIRGPDNVTSVNGG